MNELQLVQAVVAQIVTGLAAGLTNPTVALSADGTQIELSMTPSTPQATVTNFPVTNPNQPA